MAGWFTSLVLVGGCSDKAEVAEAKIRPVKTMLLDASASTQSRTYPGTVKASQEVTLAFQVAGPLIELPFKEGQEVEKGEVLARIDPRDFKTRVAKTASAVAEARATLAAMKSARPEDIRLLESHIEEANAVLTDAESRFEREKKLVDNNAGSQEQLDRATKDRNVAKIRVDTANEDLAKAKAGARPEDIDAMNARIEGFESDAENAVNAYNDTQLRAPISGVVAVRLVENFERVQAKQPVLLLQNIEQIEVVIDVPESVAARAKKGNTPKLTAVFEALPGQQFELEVKEFTTEADPATQTYRATLTMPRPLGANLLPGMTCRVIHERPPEAESAEATQFKIPVTAVLDEDGNRFVWIINEQKTVQKREVEVRELTGESIGTSGDGNSGSTSGVIRVTDGLERNEMIAISGVHFLREGDKVRPVAGAFGDLLK